MHVISYDFTPVDFSREETPPQAVNKKLPVFPVPFESAPRKTSEEISATPVDTKKTAQEVAEALTAASKANRKETQDLKRKRVLLKILTIATFIFTVASIAAATAGGLAAAGLILNLPLALGTLLAFAGGLSTIFSATGYSIFRSKVAKLKPQIRVLQEHQKHFKSKEFPVFLLDFKNPLRELIGSREFHILFKTEQKIKSNDEKMAALNKMRELKKTTLDQLDPGKNALEKKDSDRLIKEIEGIDHQITPLKHENLTLANKAKLLRQRHDFATYE